MGDLTIIGAGLAGSEAAWQAAERGLGVTLHEMRPKRMTEAHATGMFAELVCSNSLKSNDPASAPGMLKEELRMAGSLVMRAADASTVPAGSALAVDRDRFAACITESIEGHPKISIVREEVAEIPPGLTIIATGPLTSESLATSLAGIVGNDYLYFYDAIAPIVDAETIDETKAYRMSRYGKGGDDYINCPLTREEYEAFYRAVLEARKVEPRGFEEKRVFEGCMPVEVMAARGFDTLRFGPMKPVGLPDPKTGKEPFAVLQLRTENQEMTAYNMVGFQTRLAWTEQKRVFRMIPGLECAEFLRYGSIHRNTFVNGPLLLNPDLSLKARPDLLLAGQITGVEGYLESTAMGLLAGISAAAKTRGRVFPVPPAESAHGALLRHITVAPDGDFQPANINFGLFPVTSEMRRVRDKKKRRILVAERGRQAWAGYLAAEKNA
ncbi:MAG: methylenetetrahydrofolate--tRNA-(uracil(54)-C(5)) -methyltransferase (FADH(2)-oxidizing) TrmFO [Thermodesulfovibrionales bacterium]